jgi:hypothetical protein
LLTDEGKQESFPHLVDIILLLDLGDPDATVWRVLYSHHLDRLYLPHGDLMFSEEKEINLSRHL